MLMAPRNELNAGGPWFCHLAFPICLDLENKTSPWTFLGSSTPSPSQLQRGGKDRVRGRFGGGGAEGFSGKRSSPKICIEQSLQLWALHGTWPLAKEIWRNCRRPPPPAPRGVHSPREGPHEGKLSPGRRGRCNKAALGNRGGGARPPPRMTVRPTGGRRGRDSSPRTALGWTRDPKPSARP